MGRITLTQKIALGVYHPMNKKFYAVYHPEHGQNPLYISVFIDCHFWRVSYITANHEGGVSPLV